MPQLIDSKRKIEEHMFMFLFWRYDIVMIIDWKIGLFDEIHGSKIGHGFFQNRLVFLILVIKIDLLFISFVATLYRQKERCKQEKRVLHSKKKNILGLFLQKTLLIVDTQPCLPSPTFFITKQHQYYFRTLLKMFFYTAMFSF